MNIFSSKSEDYMNVTKNLEVGKNVKIAKTAIIYDNVIIEDNVEIQDFCLIGVSNAAHDKLIIGKNSIIRSHSTIYSGSSIGPNLQTGHNTLIRSGAIIGRNLSLGSYSSIEGDCKIGDYCNIHGYAQVGQGSEVGNFVWIYSLVTLTNDPLPPSNIKRPVKLEDAVVLCVNSTVLPGTVMEVGSYAGAGTVVTGVIKPGVIVKGEDCITCGHVSTLFDFETGTQHPWMRHFKERYPKESWERIENIKTTIVSSRFKK